MKTIHQNEIADCGHACLLMIASHFGYKMDLSSYRSEFFISSEGSNFQELKENAKAFKLSATGFQLPISELKNITTPCILHLYGDHFVVIEKRTKRFIHVVDPASGKRKIPIIMLHNMVPNGILYVLEFEKEAEFEVKDLRIKRSFFTFVKAIKGISHSYGQAFLFALIIQLTVIAQPFYVQLAMDDVVVNNDMDLMFLLLTGFIAISIFDVIARYTRESLIINLEKSIIKEFSIKLIRRILKLPIEFFHNRSSGALMQRLETLEKIMADISRVSTTVMIDGLLSIIMLVLMFVYSAKLTFVVLGLVILYCILKFANYSVLYKLTGVFLTDSGAEKSIIIDSFSNINTVKAFNVVDMFVDNYKQKLTKRLITAKKNSNWNNVFSTISKSIQHADTLIIVYLGIIMISENKFTVGMLYSFIFYKGQFVQNLISTLDAVIQLSLSKVNIGYINDIIDYDTEDEREQNGIESSDSSNFIINNSRDGFYDLQSDITFDKFTYSYPKTRATVFKDFSYRIPKGESACIIGKSGKGKSTLLNIISGLYRPSENQVYIDNHDINRIPLLHLRKNIAYYYPSEDFISGNLLDNISLNDNSIDIPRIVNILKGLDLYDYIMSEVPGGLEGHIGDIKFRFSTGQKRRIILARTIYKKSQLLLLDEPTESLDNITEKTVMDYLLDLNKRMILVTHKIELSDHFNNIIEL